MIDPPNWLSAINPRRSGTCCASGGGISAADVAHALGLLPAYSASLLAAIGTGDHRQAREYVAWLTMRLLPSAGQAAPLLAALAVVELLHPHHCGRCNGYGSRAGRVCERCAGLPCLPWPDARRAAVAGIAGHTWARRYRNIYMNEAHAVTGDEARAGILAASRALG